MLLAGDASGGGSGTLSLLLMMGLIFGAMYFLMIRPQQRRRREAESMQSGLGIGDEVVTIGGLHGTVAGMDDETVRVEIAPDIEVRFARGAIARVVTKSAAEEPAEDPVETD
ncbi:MAG TPA: preprotein translocase subunit YajC [Micromonosporaceae bacterium]|nr:preprotein translocase subunit YajC [Micromonosporaceae bacterium]